MTDTEIIDALRRQVADLRRQNEQLREAIAALLAPSTSELLPQNSAHPSRR
jgi:hypothetical protein